MLVLASVTSLSIGTLFVAGLLPAAVMAVCLMVLIYFRSRRRAGDPQVFPTGEDASHRRPAPFLRWSRRSSSIGGIVSGIATPTEVSSTAVIYALLLSVLFYRSLSGDAALARVPQRRAGGHGAVHH